MGRKERSGRKKERKKEGSVATGETAAATPDTYRVGSGAWWGICPAGSLRGGERDYYHLYRARFVRFRACSAGLGRVARVPATPTTCRGPNKRPTAAGSRSSAATGCLRTLRWPRAARKLGHCAPNECGRLFGPRLDFISALEMS